MNFFDFPALSKSKLIGLFLLKIIAGLSVYFFYTYYYSASDFHLYFEDSKILFDRFLFHAPNGYLAGWNSNFDDDFYNNSRVVIVVNFLLQFISFNNIFVHILFFCFISFASLTALYKSFLKYFITKKNILVVGIYLVPSVLFWTSGIYKETIALCCVGFIIYLSDFGRMRTISIKPLFCLFLLFTILFFVKTFVFMALVPLLFFNWLISRTNNKNFLLKCLLFFVSFILIIHLCSKINSRLNVYRLIADKQNKALSEAKGGVFLENNIHFIRLDYIDENKLILLPDSTFKIKNGSNYLSWKLNNMKDTIPVFNSQDTSIFQFSYKVTPANAVIEMKKMHPNSMSFYENLPSAILNVFIQPTLSRIKNILQLFSWIENTLLILLFALTIVFFDKKVLIYKDVLLFCFVFAIIQFSVIGLTAPAIGAMVRYKVTALPFLVAIFILCTDWKALLKKIKRTKI